MQFFARNTTQSSALNATAPRRCLAAAGFLGGYFHNYHLPTAKVTGATFPTAKAFAQVIQARVVQ